MFTKVAHVYNVSYLYKQIFLNLKYTSNNDDLQKIYKKSSNLFISHTSVSSVFDSTAVILFKKPSL